ncbi:MAG TPA: DUF4830 domain-containing protein [Ruminococcaceae bacterium]|jgi:hypothetical protein|nr:DUF4830 domain-containing protein [Oscillospiraceae bacterium]HCC01199.1 DUF4830 domain-containing protein [Oscillospiraceae bacterium]HCM23176.1 DUF4830 domain-containing protein [Oscillospiraceae bacterium]
MFGGETVTISFHGVKRKLFLAVAAAVLVAAIFFLISAAGAERGIPGAQNSDRINFLTKCGWQVEQEPLSVRDVAIPATFSKVYQNYNKLNEQAGFDLKKVAGKTCKQYVYRVKNYTGKEEVHATLLIYKGKIVGGDISTAALDGFMKPICRR